MRLMRNTPTATCVCRAALYAWEPVGPRSSQRLNQRIGWLAAAVSRKPGWEAVATYVDQSLHRPWDRPGLSQLLADAPWVFDVVVVTRYDQLASNRRDLQLLLARLAAARTSAPVVPSARRRIARLVANLALADLLVEAAG